MIILCAQTTIPSGVARKPTVDGLDEEWQINYLANFHLLSILSPALRAQPPDRDVRIIFATCSSYAGATLDLAEAEKRVIDSSSSKPSSKPGQGQAKGADTKKQQQQQKQQQQKKEQEKQEQQKQKQKKHNMYRMSKLALMIFAQSFQKHLSSYKRPDDCPPNARVLIVDPGLSRTPGTRRWLTGGSLWGLLLYLLTWPLWWLVLKSPQQGAQSFLYAAMDAKFGRGTGPWFIRECSEVGKYVRPEVCDEEVGRRVWEFSEKQIQEKEKEAAIFRALEKKVREELEKEKKKAASSSSSTSATGSSSSKTQTQTKTKTPKTK